jgi:hypothetical protein
MRDSADKNSLCHSIFCWATRSALVQPNANRQAPLQRSPPCPICIRNRMATTCADRLAERDLRRSVVMSSSNDQLQPEGAIMPSSIKVSRRARTDINHPSLTTTEMWVQLLREIDHYEIVIAQINKSSAPQILRGKDLVNAVPKEMLHSKSQGRTIEDDPGTDTKVITVMAGNPAVINVLRDTLAQLEQAPERFDDVAQSFADRMRAAREIGVMPAVPGELGAYELRGRPLDTDDASELLQMLRSSDTVICRWAGGERDIVAGSAAYQRSLRQHNEIDVTLIAVGNNRQVRILHAYCDVLKHRKPRTAKGWAYLSGLLAKDLNAVRDLVEPHTIRRGTKRIDHTGRVYLD